MGNLLYKYKFLLALFSALLLSLSIMFMIPILPFIALTPLFIAFYDNSFKNNIALGCLTGAIIGAITCYWMPNAVAAFASNTAFGWISYILSILIIAISFGLGSMLVFPFTKSKYPFYFTSISFALTWVLFEWLSKYFFSQAFWLHPYFLLAGLVKNGALLQSIALGSIHIPSFFCAWISIAFAILILRKNKKTLLNTAIAIICFGITNYLGIILNPIPKNTINVNASLINANHPMHLEWNENTGDKVVQAMLNLNETANKSKTPLHIWTETIVPWSFRTDDDFLNVLLKDSSSLNNGQIIGLLSDYNGDTMYNSAYYIESLHKQTERYDKMLPVSYAESPMRYFPNLFKNDFGFKIKPGKELKVFDTKIGKAGIIICNESILGIYAHKLVAMGADFLVILSNDGWVKNSNYMLEQHFYSARLRAIETRRPTLINANLGYSGGFDAAGNELQKHISDEGFVNQVSFEIANKNSNTF